VLRRGASQSTLALVMVEGAATRCRKLIKRLGHRPMRGAHLPSKTMWEAEAARWNAGYGGTRYRMESL
jgi:hypothetical protein